MGVTVEPPPAGRNLLAFRRGVRGALRLGWEVETNWIHPAGYLVFALLRPVGGALILVFIYQVAVGRPAGAAVGYLIVGAAMWSYVIAALQGISWTIVQEREWFRVLKYVVLTPFPLSAYVLSRSAVRLLTGTIGALVVLAIGALAIGVELAVNWPMLAVGMVLGLITVEAFGLALAGITLATARHGGGISEGVAGMLYLLSGAVFPPAILPPWIEPVSRYLPFTHWLETMRRSLLADYDRAIEVEGAEIPERKKIMLRPGFPCPLCGFPTYNWVENLEKEVEPEVLDYIRQNHPGWDPEYGGCDRCIEVYKLRAAGVGMPRCGS